MKSGQVESVLGSIRQSDYDGALLLLQGVLKESPRDVDALNLSGFASLYAGDLGLAQKFFEEAVAAEPHDFVAWGELGRCHLLKGDYEEAASCLEKSSALFDDADLGIKSHYGLLRGHAELHMGELDRSMLSFESACLLNGNEALDDLAELRDGFLKSRSIAVPRKSGIVLRLDRIIRKFSKRQKLKRK